jgi:hypothetical protein
VGNPFLRPFEDAAKNSNRKRLPMWAGSGVGLGS